MGAQQSACSRCCSVKDNDILASPRGQLVRDEASIDEDMSSDLVLKLPESALSHAVGSKDLGMRLPQSARSPLGKAKESSAQVANSSFALQLHSAHLSRSFAKFGWMDPYAVITVDDREVGRTVPDKWAHKDPKWESSYSWTSEGIPQTIKVSIWDKNHFHRDVFCGSVTVPCDADMGTLEHRDFILTKREKPTGYVSLTIRVERPLVLPVLERTPSLGGMEIDNLATWSRSREQSPGIHLQSDFLLDAGESGESGDEKAEPQAGAPPAEPEARSAQATAAAPANEPEAAAAVQQGGGRPAAALLGSWKCVGTEGLDEFLKATGVGIFQRKLAKAAKWPSWEYSAQGDLLVFVNHSAIGDLKEEIPIGKEYSWKDGHGNLMTCKAEWQNTPEGGVLFTTRSGAIGSYKEERRVTGNRLDFTLTHGTGVSWGRTFEREK